MGKDPSKNHPEFSVVIPSYNEVESLPELIERVRAVFSGGFDSPKTYEIIIVDDGSNDGTGDYLSKSTQSISELRAIILRRNVGKSMALMTGFLKSRGNYVVTLDADLQDNPEDIPAMLTKMGQGFQLVTGYRRKREDTLFRKIGSSIFNATVRKSTGLNIKDLNCGFKLYKAEVVKTISIYGQFHRYIPLLAHFAGFNVGEQFVKNSPRKYGISKYKTIRYQGIFDLFSILFIHNYNLSPLHFFAKIAAVFGVPSSLILLYFLFRHAISFVGVGTQYQIIERPLLSISLTMFLISIIILLTGFVCDFILHHSLPTQISRMSNLHIKEEIINSEENNNLSDKDSTITDS